jgi:hypothetical protein
MPGRNLSPEEKARVVEDSVNWPNNEGSLRTSTSPLLRLSDEPGNTNAEGHIDSTQKKKAIDDAMNWLRNDPNPADVDDPTAQGLANLLATHARPSVSGGEGPVVEDSVNWPQQRCEEDVNEPTLTALTNSGNTNAEGHIDSTQKKKAIDDAMNWLRNNDPNPADVDDPTAKGWRTLLLPMPGRLSPEEKARVVDSVNWLRNNDVKPEDVNEPTLTALTNLGEQCRRGKLTPPRKRRRPLTTR